jgi:hypothetical protein
MLYLCTCTCSCWPQRHHSRQAANPHNPSSRKTAFATASSVVTTKDGVAALRNVFVHMNDKWDYLEPLLAPYLHEAQLMVVTPTTGQATNLFDSDEDAPAGNSSITALC